MIGLIATGVYLVGYVLAVYPLFRILSTAHEDVAAKRSYDRGKTPQHGWVILQASLLALVWPVLLLPAASFMVFNRGRLPSSRQLTELRDGPADDRPKQRVLTSRGERDW